MNKYISVLLTLNLFIYLLPMTVSTQNIFRPDSKAYQKADQTLAKMSLDEKIGQLVHIGINGKFMNQDSFEFRNIKKQITENKVGGIIVFVGEVYETVHLVNRMQEFSKLPLLISADFETGVGMRMKDTINLPWNMAVAATGKPAFARRMGATVAKEAKALGIQQVFGPVIDVNNNAENPVINVRSFGENPGDVARFGIAFANGLQSENIIATAKHFPGHGDTAVDSHRGLPVINYSPERMENTEFLPFRQIIKSGVGSVMISHISLPQLDNEEVKPLKNSIKAEYTEAEIITENTTIPATLSKNIVTGLLKKDMNFDGLVVTDAMDMSGLTLYFDQSEAAVRAILAGNDILLKPADTDATLAGIKKAVQTGRITQKRIDESVRKILAWKYKLGLFEKKITPLDKIDRIVSAQETLNLSNDIARNAITLVKNNDKLLPLKEKQKVFALNITNGKDIDAVGKEFINSLRANGLEVTSLTLDERSGEKDFNRALIESNKSDLVITALFGRVRSGAKNSIGIPEAGENVLRQILKQDKPNISVAFGNPYLILGFPEMKNYIVAYGDMVSLQEATANALTGKIDFKGKLPITIGDFKRGSGLKIK